MVWISFSQKEPRGKVWNPARPPWMGQIGFGLQLFCSGADTPYLDPGSDYILGHPELTHTWTPGADYHTWTPRADYILGPPELTTYLDPRS